MPPNPVVKRLKVMVNELAATLPVIQNMRNPALKDRHWKKMETLIGRKVINNNKGLQPNNTPFTAPMTNCGKLKVRVGRKCCGPLCVGQKLRG